MKTRSQLSTEHSIGTVGLITNLLIKFFEVKIPQVHPQSTPLYTPLYGRPCIKPMVAVADPGFAKGGGTRRAKCLSIFI